ncbi:hypothetical protein ACFYZ8_06140 [Streptomyces sp. NPDC001668]
MTGQTRVVAHEVRRLEVAVDRQFEEFRQCYEQAVPSFNPDHFGDLDPDRTD